VTTNLSPRMTTDPVLESCDADTRSPCIVCSRRDGAIVHAGQFMGELIHNGVPSEGMLCTVDVQALPALPCTFARHSVHNQFQSETMWAWGRTR
jgi:hypothetical protein